MIRIWSCLLAILVMGQCSSYPEPNYLAWALLLRRSLNPIKSVTGFSTSMSSTPMSVAVTEVDMSKAFVLCSFRAGVGAIAANRVPTCQLSSSTNVSISAGAPDATVFAAGFLAEFSSGVRVQRGSTTMSATILNSVVAIDAVDTGRSFVIAYARTAGAGGMLDEERTVMAQLSGSSQISFTRMQGANAAEVEWQVVEMQDASVQAGQAVIPNASNQIMRPISSVDTSKSFVIFTAAADANSNGNDSEIWARCGLPDSSSVLCGRQDTLNNLSFSYFVVSMNDASSVLRGHEDTNLRTPPADNSDISMPVTIASGFDRSRSLALICSAVDPGDSDNGQDSAAFSAELGTDSISIQRGSNDNRRAIATWTIVQFSR